MAGPFSKLEDTLVAGPKDIRWEEAKDVLVAGPEDVRRDGAGIEIAFCVGLAAEKGGAIPSKARGDRSREARQSGSTVAEYGEVSAQEIVYCVGIVAGEYSTPLLKTRTVWSMEARHSRSVMVGGGGLSPKIRKGLGPNTTGASILSTVSPSRKLMGHSSSAASQMRWSSGEEEEPGEALMDNISVEAKIEETGSKPEVRAMLIDLSIRASRRPTVRWDAYRDIGFSY